VILRPVFVSNKENKFCNLFPSSFLTRTTAVSSIGAGARVSPRLPCGWPRHWYCREVPGPPSQALRGHCDRCVQQRDRVSSFSRTLCGSESSVIQTTSV
jgi:hypothetical protein